MSFTSFISKATQYKNSSVDMLI